MHTCLFPLLVVNWHFSFTIKLLFFYFNWFNLNIEFFIANIFHSILSNSRKNRAKCFNSKLRTKFQYIGVSWYLSDHFLDFCYECVVLILNRLPICQNKRPEKGVYTPNCSCQMIIRFGSGFKWGSLFESVFVAKYEKWFTLGRFWEYFRLCWWPIFGPSLRGGWR